MPPPDVVQVTVLTASDSVVPWEVIGSSSFAFFTSTFQPGLGWALTNAKGVSSGRVTRILVVEAVSDSVETRKTTLPNPPAAASGLETVTMGRGRRGTEDENSHQERSAQPREVS